MTKAERDNNSVPTILAVLNTDGETITPIKADPNTNVLDISDGTSGSDAGQDNAERDPNMVPVLIATSSADGSTPVPLYADSDGKLLIKST